MHRRGGLRWGACPDAKPCDACVPRDCEFSDWGQWYSGGGCEGLEAGLMRGVDADGRPVLPLPDAFCGAMTALSDAECLCDPALEDLSNAFTMTPILQSLCPGARWVSQRQGNC